MMPTERELPPEFPEDLLVIGNEEMRASAHGHFLVHRELRWWAGRRAGPGDWVEFGVKGGKSAKQFLRHMPLGIRLFLLDSFEGLPEEWVINAGEGDLPRKVKPAGHFACPVPKIPDRRAQIIKGWFKDTAEELRSRTDQVGLVHIDCDLYSSTVDAFAAVEPMIGPGTILVFDEVWGYGEWRQGEYRALVESGLEYEWIARGEGTLQAVARIV